VQSTGLLEQVDTLGALRKLVAGDSAADSAAPASAAPVSAVPSSSGPVAVAVGSASAAPAPAPTESSAGAARTNGTPIAATPAPLPRRTFVYPLWPWWLPVQLVRSAFTEVLMRPFCWLFANPRVVPSPHPLPHEPMLIVANHVTSYDAALMIYALPNPLRHEIAIAMSGEMLHDFLHWRNFHHVVSETPGAEQFNIFGPPSWFLLTALFNVFPLPRQRDFQASFAHAGKALDRGYSVMVFPEGARSAEGTMVKFRPGIGLLARQSSVPVLPMALLGLGELKVKKRGCSIPTRSRSASATPSASRPKPPNPPSPRASSRKSKSSWPNPQS